MYKCRMVIIINKLYNMIYTSNSTKKMVSIFLQQFDNILHTNSGKTVPKQAI